MERLVRELVPATARLLDEGWALGDAVQAARRRWATPAEEREHWWARWSLMQPEWCHLLGAVVNTRVRYCRPGSLASMLRGGQANTKGNAKQRARTDAFKCAFIFSQAPQQFEQLDDLAGGNPTLPAGFPTRLYASGGAERYARRGNQLAAAAEAAPPPYVPTGPLLTVDDLRLVVAALSLASKPGLWDDNAVAADHPLMAAVDGDGLSVWWAAGGVLKSVHVRMAFVDAPEGCAGWSGTTAGMLMQHVVTRLSHRLVMRSFGWIPNFQEGWGTPRMLGELAMTIGRWGANVSVSVAELMVRLSPRVS
jgi:hypothetical protein